MTLERSRRLINGVWKYVTAAEDGGGGSQTLAEVLATGSDPDGNEITGAVVIDNADTGTRALTVDAVGDSGEGIQVAQFRKADGTRLLEVSESSADYTGTRPQVYISERDVFVTVQDDGGGFQAVDPTGALLFNVAPTGGVQIFMQTGSSSTPLTVQAQDGASYPLYIAPTGEVWLGNFAAKVDAAGRYSTSAHSAPADGDIADGEMTIWFDQTNGAAKLKIKAKQANGTVVTGEVALAP